MGLLFQDGRPFSIGQAEYQYRPVRSTSDSNRILVQVVIEGISTLAVVDTGAPYVICAPDIARSLGLSPEGALGDVSLRHGGARIRGHLHRLKLEILADQGENLTVQATAFIPDPDAEETWGEPPSFLGLMGCLERMRFAVDPLDDTFYFGPEHDE